MHVYFSLLDILIVIRVVSESAAFYREATYVHVELHVRESSMLRAIESKLFSFLSITTSQRDLCNS